MTRSARGGRTSDALVVRGVSADRAGEVVAVFCDAFAGYPVMRYVIGPGAEYDRRLQALIGYFVAARVWRSEPMLGIDDGAAMVAAAIMTPPGHRDPPAGMIEARETLWEALGPAARSRYESLGGVWRTFAVDEPNLHLNMIGVRSSHAGRGLGLRVMDAVHRMSETTDGSAGVTLTTEDRHNVEFYRRLGYEIVGHAHVTDDLETWGFFRRNGAAPGA